MTVSVMKPAIDVLRDEQTSLRKQLAWAKRQLAEERKKTAALERRLFGALYELYGDWARVNREVPRA